MKVTEQTSDLVAFASVRIHSTVSFSVSGQWFLQTIGLLSRAVRICASSYAGAYNEYRALVSELTR